MIQRVTIAFVDDTDFYTNSESYQRNIQKIMGTYILIYKATGGKIYYLILGNRCVEIELRV